MSLFSIATAGQLHPGLEQEWLLTNGLGGFSSSSVIGCNRRRYHGLLVAATLPPVGRTMLLSRLAEQVIFDASPKTVHELAVNQFNDSFFPLGQQYLQFFEVGSTAKWSYLVEDARITKEVHLCWMKNIVGMRYTLEPVADKAFEFRVMPFAALRDFHALRRGQSQMDVHGPAEGSDPGGGASVVVSSEGKTVHLTCDRGTFVTKPDWWFGHTYQIERDRGQDFVEDLYTPGYFSLRVEKRTVVTLWAGLASVDKINWDAETALREKAVAKGAGSSSASETCSHLARAANDFVVYRKAPDGQDGSSVIAGYPWFADWGRDTMISLPGLFLTTGRFAQAKQVLSVFAQYVSQGMIPNRFDDYTGKPDYNTVDASLWFIHAAFEYARLSGDKTTFDVILRPACQQIIDGYRDGTRFNIKMDVSDGLIAQGDASTQLTWMDAKMGDTAFTPRQGKPVEINALWYHALVLMGETKLAEQVRTSFRRAFWINPFRGLADVVDGPMPSDEKSAYAQRDTRIRPNQIFAVSLANSALTPEQQAAVVEVVRRELLTPMGLRTLGPSEEGYRGRYTGDQWSRDSAYHNGTVWPWPIGAFVEAYLRVNQHSAAAKVQAKSWLTPLVQSMQTGCIGQIGEIYDGDPPHRAVGACAQAWSVAEVLRLAVLLEM